MMTGIHFLFWKPGPPYFQRSNLSLTRYSWSQGQQNYVLINKTEWLRKLTKPSFAIHMVKYYINATLMVGMREIVINIILSCHQHRYPWPSPYYSSLLAGPLGYILYPHRAAVCRFEPISLLLLGYMRGSIGEHHLWACPLLLQQCHACLVRLTLIVFVMGGRWPYSCCFVRCCLQDLFKIARSILV